MEGLDTFAAFAATYDSLADAEADYDAVKSLYYDDGIVDTFDAAIIEKDDKGKVKIVKKHEQPLRQGAWVGGGLGLAAGLVVALQNFLATSDFPVTVITGVVFMVCVLLFRRGLVGEFYGSWVGRKLGFDHRA